ncbi:MULTISPECIES: alanine dehydrogenase [unclassified Pseudofrankia]|uniref:alanine dehydrogenase n=1 Tax=unclassified Pseudofrankia TaxID=2994372 RepID=UPI0008D9BC86|nr:MULTISPECIES: alanine dehydrogenase [unclassified Pseudofrankia]MDT3445590.1 alanine dehydrogenase [Pseudofrankia sp. BMG5.37]OHV47809.1 alanine dehydrogenase [Pseudofrankia sp. BMG5.36]
MRIAIPREVKNHEYRVAATPAGVHELTRHGHDVFVEADAGAGSMIMDAEYAAAGAKIVEGADATWASGDLVLKVKEPVEEEYHRLRPGLLLFTYLHLAASLPCTRALLDARVTAVGYETVEFADRSLPLLAPMSEVAGRLAPQVGAQALLAAAGGRGVLLGGVPGVDPARVVVIGAGVAGQGATSIAAGMRADVTLLDRDLGRLRAADARFEGRVRTIAANAYEIERAVLDADLVIGAVLVPGTRAPKLVTNAMVARMRPGAVLVDISVDQGGCFEDTRPTTHDNPTYKVHEAVFYCVANMPGAVPRTSTHALTNATLPYAAALADHGWRGAMRLDPALARGLNTHAGEVTCAPVAEAHGLPSVLVAAVLDAES